MSTNGSRPKSLGALIARPFRAQARSIAAALDGEAQMALGSVCVDTSIPLFVVGFFVEEPFLVYQMSAAAIFWTGLAFIAGGQAVLESEKATEKEGEVEARLVEILAAVQGKESAA